MDNTHNKHRLTFFGRDIDNPEQLCKSDNIFNGSFFIFVGIIFLLNTLDIVPFEIWKQIFQAWPILIILIGVKIALGENPLSKLIISLASLVIFFSLLIFILSYYAPQLIDWVPYEAYKYINIWREVIVR